MSNAAPDPRVVSRARASRIAESAVTRARLRVVPRARQRAPRVPFVALVTLVLVAGVVGLLLFNTSMQQASFTVSTLEDRATALTAEEQTLAVELEEMRNPQRIAERAQKLGMVLPTTWCSLTLADAKPSCPATAGAPGAQVRLHPLPVSKPSIYHAPPVTDPETKTPGDTLMASPVEGSGQGRNGGDQDRRTRSGDRAPR